MASPKCAVLPVNPECKATEPAPRGRQLQDKAGGVAPAALLLIERRVAAPVSKAFSSEVDTGSRHENASNQKSRAPFRFNRNGKGSGVHRHSRLRSAGHEKYRRSPAAGLEKEPARVRYPGCGHGRQPGSIQHGRPCPHPAGLRSRPLRRELAATASLGLSENPDAGIRRRVAAPAMKRGKRVDFTGYRQRHIAHQATVPIKHTQPPIGGCLHWLLLDWGWAIFAPQPV
jgi:hypothetical protein